MTSRTGVRQGLRIGPRQQQRLRLTPQVRQTIEMLSLPLTELRIRVEQELRENPALEEAPSTEEEEDDAAPEEPDEETEGEDPADAVTDLDAESWFEEYRDRSGNSASGDEPPSFERTLPAVRTLADQLGEQLGPEVTDERDRNIGIEIIGNLDERGYLDATVEEIARVLEVEPSEVEAIRTRILRFDPPGCACFDIEECLMVQLELRGESEGALARIVRDHLDLLMGAQFRDLARALGEDIDAVMQWVRQIGELDFRPGSRYARSVPSCVIPDARAYRMGGRWRVEMNDEIPRLRASPMYRAFLQSAESQSAVERAFVSDAWSRAKGFERSVRQRQETVRLVAEDIVRKQEDFLNEGIERIRPLVLNDVARDIGRAESTVSRVVNEKYLATPRGVIPFRRFFHSALSLRNGQQVSSEAVKARVRRVIAREDPEHPLADDQIVQLLGRDGVMIARRTVAKYRKVLRIPSSNERRVRYRNLPPGHAADAS